MDDNKIKDILLDLTTRKRTEKYTKIIQKSFDETEEKKDEEINIKIDLIAIIYKNINKYEFKFRIIKYNNQINIEKFINKDSIYVYYKDKINCKKFNEKFTQDNNISKYLNNIKKENKKKLYILSYIFNDKKTFNILLHIPIIIILTNSNKLIMIDYIDSSTQDSSDNNIIDLTILSIISKQLSTTIGKYLKNNFENELSDILDNYDNDLFNIIFDNINEKYRTSNNINEIINIKKVSEAIL